MQSVNFFATPWWVNLLILIPVAAFVYSRKNKFFISRRRLAVVALFGIAFGFVEASVVIYLRAVLGLLPGYMGTLSDIIRESSNYNPNQAIGKLPIGLFTVEFYREAATIIMLATIAILSVRKFKERCAVFLFAFAFWDLFYYVFLWLITRWPSSLTSLDVLFLIPVPWISQVWFPLLISILTIVVIATRSSEE
ncbi:MAG: hypothetical protein KGJ35_03485 [Patescibacteria group bacterium]|nr:hypothetical protein [Patescibacteria group bacterium]